jgi:esterase/lipase
MKRYTILMFLILLIILQGCAEKVPESLKPYDSYVLSENKEGQKELVLVTAGGKNIRATDYGGNFNQNVILLHMLGGNRKDYDNLAKLLHKNSFRVLTLDFQGHGESKGNWQEFDSRYFKELVQDVEVAHKYLKKESQEDKVSLIGASIGANIALTYANDNKDVVKIILLSPGEEYRNVYAEIKTYTNPILLISSKEDTYSFDTVRSLKEDLPESSKTLIYSGESHGSNILSSHPELKKEIVNFLREE